MHPPRQTLITFAALSVAACASAAYAHGFVGDRFFPATIATDDPLATDELALPTLSLSDSPPPGGGPRGGPDTTLFSAGFEFDKEIFPHFALGVSDDIMTQRPSGGPTINGWDNLTLTAKYELYRNLPHEFIFSVGMEGDIGRTGNQRVGSVPFSTVTPIVYFGKGMGDLPDSVSFLKPLAVTGTLGQSFPTRALDPNQFLWGLAVEYNLIYLQDHVADVGLPQPFKKMIPLVEFNMATPENRGSSLTTGQVCPGLLYETRFAQFGAEALIPINNASGEHVGVIFQVQIYIDDLFPTLFGHPIFGGE